MPIINSVIASGPAPTGTKQITNNGTHDVAAYEYADVQVPTTAPAIYREFQLDANGVLGPNTTTTHITNFTGVKNVNAYMLAYAYSDNTAITGTVDMSDMTAISGIYSCCDTFKGCTNLTGVDLSSLAGITGSYSCSDMFMNCTNLTSVDLSSLTGISGGNGGYQMFKGCTSLTSIDLSSLISLSGNAAQNMFDGCTSLTSVDLRSLTTIGNSGAREMFKGCTNLTNINLSSLENPGGGTSACQSMFEGCTGLTTINLNIIQSRAANNYSNMFKGCTSLTSINWESLASVGDNYGCSSMFEGCTGLTHVDLSYLIRADGRNALQNMFKGCTNLTSVNLPRLCKLGSYNNIANMFEGTSLTSLSFPNLAYTTNNINSSFYNTLSGVTGCTVHFPADWQTDMTGASYTNITNGLGGTNTIVLFDLPAVTTLDFSYMVVINNLELLSFGNNCVNITSVDFDNLAIINNSSGITSSLTGCTSLTSLSFPSLNSVFNNNVFSGMLNGVTGCTVHFPSNLSSKNFNCGGTNTTILYDLPATNTLTGADSVIYTRNPKSDTATALAWKVGAYGTENFTPAYYTSGLTDPTISDTIYSDSACTTAVTTISSIA